MIANKRRGPKRPCARCGVVTAHSAEFSTVAGTHLCPHGCVCYSFYGGIVRGATRDAPQIGCLDCALAFDPDRNRARSLRIDGENPAAGSADASTTKQGEDR